MERKAARPRALFRFRVTTVRSTSPLVFWDFDAGLIIMDDGRRFLGLERGAGLRRESATVDSLPISAGDPKSFSGRLGENHVFKSKWPVLE